VPQKAATKTTFDRSGRCISYGSYNTINLQYNGKFALKN